MIGILAPKIIKDGNGLRVAGDHNIVYKSGYRIEELHNNYIIGSKKGKKYKIPFIVTGSVITYLYPNETI